jgi:hypothetical protein
MPVLWQAGVLAQLLGLCQQLSGETEVVVLAVEGAHADVHVRCPAQHRPVLARVHLQRLLVGAHRVAQPALGDPEVSQSDRAREYV